MNLHLKRLRYLESGIYGNLIGDGINLYTLEHSYRYHPEAVFSPKIPQGVYTCKRGIHQLQHGGPFETFEVTGVQGHTGLLFHKGNWNADSNGCLLLGLEIDLAKNMLLESAVAFDVFMKAQDDDRFLLTVEN